MVAVITLLGPYEDAADLRTAMEGVWLGATDKLLPFYGPNNVEMYAVHITP